MGIRNFLILFVLIEINPSIQKMNTYFSYQAVRTSQSTEFFTQSIIKSTLVISAAVLEDDFISSTFERTPNHAPHWAGTGSLHHQIRHRKNTKKKYD